VTSVPRWEPDGTESPAERTDPLLPAITDDMLPPLDLPRLPMLDDQTLAQMLAELDGDDEAPGDSNAVGEPAIGGERQPSVPTADPAADLSADLSADPSADSAASPAEPSEVRAGNGSPVSETPRSHTPSTAHTPVTAHTPSTGHAPSTGHTGHTPAPSERPLRLVEHPGGPVGYRAARGPVGRTRGGTSKYVRRDLRPPEVHADALNLTGLTRRSRSRVGSILFTVVFVGIFLLILVQAIVSLLTPGS
jgi:hypothetical protein